MNPYHLLVAVVGIAAVAGCASAGGQQARVQDDDRTYVTGSRIPVKEPGSGSAKTISEKSDIDKFMNRGGNATGGVLGAGGS